MKQAYIILAHANLKQLEILLNRLDYQENIIILHLDKKLNNEDYDKLYQRYTNKNNIYFIEDRENCSWGDFSIIDATNKCISYLLDLNEEFTHAILLSGMDFTIKSQKFISEFLNENKDFNFVEGSQINKYADANRYNIYYFKWARYIKNSKLNKLVFRAQYKLSYLLKLKRNHPKYNEVYFGSQWWAINKYTLKELNKFIIDNPKYMKFYKNTNIPDEFFYQTIIYNRFSDKTINKNLHLIEWENDKAFHPNIFTIKDKDKLINSESLFARKFDISTDNEVIEYLNQIE